MEKKFDIIEDSYQAFRLAHSLTKGQLDKWLTEHNKTIVSHRAIGLHYTEVIVNR